MHEKSENRSLRLVDIKSFLKSPPILFQAIAELFIIAKPVLRIDPERQVVRQGDSPTVQCSVIEGDPPYEVSWYKEDETGVGSL